MFQEGDYRNGDEPLVRVEASNSRGKWAGFLYERNDGGFDLFYDHDNSEFKSLGLEEITLLRCRSVEESGAVFIGHLEKEKEPKNIERSSAPATGVGHSYYWRLSTSFFQRTVAVPGILEPQTYRRS